MSYEDKKISDDNLSDVSGGLAKQDLAKVLAKIDFNKIAELITLLRNQYPDVDAAIAALTTDASNIAPLVQALIQTLGEAQLAALIREKWNNVE